MVNKRVPDWLNSSLWSSPAPQQSSAQPPSPSPLNEDNAVKVSGSASGDDNAVKAPVVIRAESKHAPTRANKAETRDPLGCSSGNCYHSDDENGSSASSTTSSAAAAAAAAVSSAEDISRQAQLFQEVKFALCRINYLFFFFDKFFLLCSGCFVTGNIVLI